MHVDEEVLAPIRARYGEPAVVEWEGEITAREFAVATYDPARTHDVTLFILNGPRLALIRKPMFPADIWRPPGGGVKRGFVYGKSDATGSYPDENPVRPEDLAATLYYLLGMNPEAEIIDRNNRPLVIAGKPVLDVIA